MSGTIPYGEADAMFGTAGNRFAIRIYNRGIDERSDLPTGTIVKTTNTNAPSGYNNGNRSDFEDDGSLIAVFAPTAETKSAYNREVKIKWAAGEDFTVYTFDLSGATLAPAVYPVTTTVTNGTYTGATQITAGSTATVTIVPNNGYVLPENVTVTGGASHTYDSTTGAVVLSNATGATGVIAVCTEAPAPTPSLTPFSVGQTIGGIQVDTTKSVSDVVSVLAQLTYEGEQEQMANLLAVTDYIMMAMKQPNEQDRTMYAIVVVPRGGSEADMLPIFISETVPDFATEGWNNLTDGVVDVNIGAITAIEQSSLWNDGTIFGAVTE